LSVKPRIVDPDYIFVTINSKVKYNPSTAVNTEDSIKDLVVSSIKTYNSNEVEKFDGILRHSKLVAEIDKTDNAIRSNVTDISLKKRITPTLNLPEAFTLNYNQGFDRGSLTSNEFTVEGIEGNVKFGVDTQSSSANNTLLNLTLVNSSDVIQNYNVGTVDHINGIITITGLQYMSILDGTRFINIIVPYTDQDVVPNKTQIVSVYPSDITVTMIKDTTD